MDVQSLAVQKGELDSQLSEKKTRLVHYKKEQQKEEETLHNLHSAIKKHKAGQLQQRGRFHIWLNQWCEWKTKGRKEVGLFGNLFTVEVLLQGSKIISGPHERVSGQLAE